MNPKNSIIRIYIVIILIILTLDLLSSSWSRRRTNHKMKRRGKSRNYRKFLNCPCGYFKHNYKVKLSFISLPNYIKPLQLFLLQKVNINKA